MEVHVVVSDPDRAVGTERNDHVTVHSIGGARHFGNVLLALPDRRRIAKALRALRPDVVHAHSAHREALGAIESGLPTVVTIHGMMELELLLEKRPGKRLRGLFRRELIRRVHERARNVIVLSPTVEQHYRGRLPRARLWMIENPVDDSFFRDHAAPDPGTLLFSGFLIRRKGVRNLLEAFRMVRERVPGARLRLAGQATEPGYGGRLHEIVRSANMVDAVDFLGHVSPAEMAAEYVRAAVFVLVSRQETLPVAIQEAMAVGRPVVASPVGGIPNIVKDGENGYLVPHGDPSALAARLVELLRDPDLRERLGAAARRLAAERFRVESVSRRTLDVYREVIAAHGVGVSPGRQ